MSAAFQYHVTVAEACIMYLTCNFTTWHVNHDLFFVSSNASGIVQSVPVFYTVGWWNVTDALLVHLVAGKNVLQFWRNSTRGMAIKEFILHPVK
eukprot:SAG31_NODE_7726_length_1608_cov_1.298211_2_plen_94_part_00